MQKGILLLLASFFMGMGTALAQEEIAHVRFANFVAQSFPADFYLDDELPATDIYFPVVSDWVEVSAGARIVRVTETGETDALFEPQIIDVAADSWVTFALIAGNEQPSLQVLVEDFSDIPAGLTRLSIFNALPDWPPLTISVNDIELVRGLGYPGAFNDGYATRDIQAKAYDIAVTDGQDETAIELEDVNLQSDTHYLLAVVGWADNPQYVLLESALNELLQVETPFIAFEPTAGSLSEGKAFFRAAHFAPGTPDIRIIITGESTVERVLRFPQLGEWSQVAAGMYEVAVFPADETADTPLFTATLPLSADSHITLAAIGEMARDTFTLHRIEEDYSLILSNETRIGVFHAMPDGGAVTMRADGNIRLSGLAYPGYLGGDSDGYATVDLLENHYTITFETEDGTELLDIGEFNLSAEQNTFIAVVGLQQSPTFVLVKTDPEGE